MKLFFLTFPIFLIIDFIWLGAIAKNLYAKLIPFEMQINWIAAILTYIVIVGSIIYFIVPKANGDIFKGAINGAILGALMYGIYDLTNKATLKGWPWKLVVIDIIWGTVLYSIVSAIAVFISNKI